MDNEHILTASGDSNCILWDIEHRQPIAAFTAHSGDVEAVAHNKSSHNTFLSGSIDTTARLWDYRLKSYQSNIRTFAGHESDINDVQWFPDHQAFGTASDDGTVCPLHCLEHMLRYKLTVHQSMCPLTRISVDYGMWLHIKPLIFMETKWNRMIVSLR